MAEEIQSPQDKDIAKHKFDAESAKALAAEMADKKRREAEEHRAEFQKRKLLADKMLEELPRDKLASIMLAGAQRIAIEVLTGNIPVRNATDAAAAINSMVNVARLEMGESTSNTANLTTEEQLARVRALRTAAQDREKELRSVGGEGA